MTFKEYLAGRQAGHDAAGDFVRLARADARFPDAAHLDEVLSYLSGRGDYQALETARQLWEQYAAGIRQAKRARTRDA